jgi:hypothetical protein
MAVAVVDGVQKATSLSSPFTKYFRFILETLMDYSVSM